METAEIKHLTLSSLDERFKKSRSTVITEAGHLLGYRLEKHDLLLEALKKLRIAPLNAEDVAAYKASKTTRKSEITSRDSWGNTRRTTAHVWHITDISTFAGDIPEAVLSKAVEIKKEVPGAKFEIEHLVEVVSEKREKKRERRLPDPFLVAVMGKERIYIEVWDEPDFEKTLYA